MKNLRRHMTIALMTWALCLTMVPALSVQPALAASIADIFLNYYNQYQGMRVLGNPLTDLTEISGYPAQYFEKGRIEDHRRSEANPLWAFMYGRLTEELMLSNPVGNVSGTTLTYSDLALNAAPQYRHPAPDGFTGGTVPGAGGVFVPYDPQLRNAAGYIVPTVFWDYINRTDLFPGGWLHDVGLPMTDAFTVETSKNGLRRTITIQAFERAVLTYDLLNPPDWQVERANIGADAVASRTSPLPPPTGQIIEIPAAGGRYTLPVPILARFGTPGQNVLVTLRWQDGSEYSRAFELLSGEDGRGMLITAIDRPELPATTQLATVEIRHSSNVLIAAQSITLLGRNDPDTQEIALSWLQGEPPQFQSEQRRIPRSYNVGLAALEALLWGPRSSQSAFRTALPSPIEVLSYAGREAGWGPRVTVRSLTVDNGVATVTFSREMWAYGNDPVRWQFIQEQVTRTLAQFSGVREVRITIDGQPMTVTPTGGSLQQARDTLITFFQLLHDRRYAEAVSLYGGDYEQLRKDNPSINQFDYPALLQAACEKNGFRCLNVGAVVQAQERSSNEFRFEIEFTYDDGRLFAEDGRTRFTYNVVRMDTTFLVLELPVRVD